MARYSDKTACSLQDLRNFANRLRIAAASCEAQCDMAEHAGFELLEVTHFKTAEDGVEAISKFLGAVAQAASSATMKGALKPAGEAAKQKRKKPQSGD